MYKSSQELPFPLKPLETAVVSEISEATAQAQIADQDKINFHIGNPIQDNRLSDLYFRLAAGRDLDTILLDEELGEADRDILKFIYSAIKGTVAYMPRGGYQSKNPHPVLEYLNKWLTAEQEDPLNYSYGENKTPRECILFSGGETEFLRVLFSALNRFSRTALNILPVRKDIPDYLQNFAQLNFHKNTDVPQTITFLNGPTNTIPTVLLISCPLYETDRRVLRNLSEKRPILYIEINDAPNHSSLAREAGLKYNVIRFLKAFALNNSVQDSAIQFVLGNSELLKRLEAVHFELKGTPSATEAALLNFRLHNPWINVSSPVSGTQYSLLGNGQTETVVPADDNPIVNDMLERMTAGISRYQKRFSGLTEKTITTADSLQTKALTMLWRQPNKFPDVLPVDDSLLKFSAQEMVKVGMQEPLTLQKSFLAHFAKLHSFYTYNNLTVVSGSSRTALSLLGHHCGFDEVVVPDWSWTYENCFQKVEAVPLKETLQPDVGGIFEVIDNRLISDPSWNKHGVFALNNPHNASGQVFDKKTVKELIVGLLKRNIFVVDDLAYQNVAPSSVPIHIKTVKELALDAVKEGLISGEQLRLVVTAHALSKTDCFAGARLCAVEILDETLLKNFRKVAANIQPNTMALVLAYLFYRNPVADVKEYYNFRNRLFAERTRAIAEAMQELPEIRNAFGVKIHLPKASMYPLLFVRFFPSGISIDNVAAKLAQRGIGMVPLTAFSRTARSMVEGRKTFRLTLGGKADRETMKSKTRRLVIEINRLLHEESRSYTTFALQVKNPIAAARTFNRVSDQWNYIIEKLWRECKKLLQHQHYGLLGNKERTDFLENYLPWRLSVLEKRFNDYQAIAESVLNDAYLSRLPVKLKQEFYKDNIQSRQERFRYRLFDRTVHPTQMYSLKVDSEATKIIYELFSDSFPKEKSVAVLGQALVEEFVGINVPINSEQEANELIYDLNASVLSEVYQELVSDIQQPAFLSFWGDWDGSTRPSGQGHRLVAAVVLENVRQMAHLINILLETDGTIQLENELVNDLKQLEKDIERFWALLNKITLLTNQLEKRYKGLLPVDWELGLLKRIAIKSRLMRDPIAAAFQHNDSLETRMLELRRERSRKLEYYFELNKRLRKKLYSLIPVIELHLKKPQVAIAFAMYRDLLKRFALTPRIHQKTITADDSFTIENTVYNLLEINDISGRQGNPQMVLALQISMSTNPEALISLQKMVASKSEEISQIKKAPLSHPIWLVPLFEDQDSLEKLETYLDRVWEYAQSARNASETTGECFSRIICEIFVAGSDLSQQIGQANSFEWYKKTKITFNRWLVYKGLTDKIRIKLGSGEPMQRQGGYYSKYSGKAALFESANKKENAALFKPVHWQNLLFARSPLEGLYNGSDLRTIQSNASEHIFRFLTTHERSSLLYHLSESQKSYQRDLERISRLFNKTRLNVEQKGIAELKRLDHLEENSQYSEFLQLYTENFRHILYGRDEDIFGIHVISYFVSRLTPILRDRPVVRPTREVTQSAGQKIVERIAQTLPLSRHGSLLRAIGHNQAQTMITGINQLTCGIFKTLEQIKYRVGEGPLGQIISNLPVKDILHTLRIYHQEDMKYLLKMETAFNRGNSSIRAAKEDILPIKEYIPFFQKELFRRQGLNPDEYFNGDIINENILGVVRPDLAVLLQKDLFNSDLEQLANNNTKNLDLNWIKQTEILLQAPVKIRFWRDKIWQIIEHNIFQQVKSFSDLAVALMTLSQKLGIEGSFISGEKRSNRMINEINSLLRGTADDSMRQFLFSVVDYLARLPRDKAVLPIDTLRVLRDVQKIVKIDEQVLTSSEQSSIRFYILNIARIAGENG